MSKKTEFEQGYKKIDELNEKYRVKQQELQQLHQEIMDLHKKLIEETKNPENLFRYQAEILATNNNPDKIK